MNKIINFEFRPELIKFQNSTFFQVLWGKPCPYCILVL